MARSFYNYYVEYCCSCNKRPSVNADGESLRNPTDNSDQQYSRTNNSGEASLTTLADQNDLFNAWISYLKNYLPAYPETAKEKWNYVGIMTTLVSTIPQGLFAALLADAIAVKLGVSPEAALIPDFIFFATALIGKFALMRFYNKESFREMADFDWKTMLTSNFWLRDERGEFSTAKIISYLFSIVGSGVFAGLSILASLDTAKLAKEYNTPVGDAIEITFSSPYTQAFFFIANMGSNMLFFPGMNKYALSRFVELIRRSYDSFAHPLQHTAYLQSVARFNQGYNPLVTEFNHLVNLLKNPEDKAAEINTACQTLLTSLKPMFDLSDIEGGSNTLTTHKDQLIKTLNSLLENTDNQLVLATPIARNYFSNITVSNSPNAWGDHAATIVTLGLTAVCIAGLTNFWDISAMLADKAHLSPIRYLVAAMDMIDMSAMSFVSTIGYQPFIAGLLQTALKQQEVQLLNMYQLSGVLLLSAGICILGGMPNAYQSLAIAKQALSFVILSLAASCIIESSGVLQLYTGQSANPIRNKLLQSEEYGVLFANMAAVLKEIKKQQPQPKELPALSFASMRSGFLCCVKKADNDNLLHRDSQNSTLGII